MAVRKRSLFGYSVFQLLPGGLCDCGKMFPFGNVESSKDVTPFSFSTELKLQCLLLVLIAIARLTVGRFR